MKRVFLTLLLAFGLSPCWALPTLQDVQAQVRQGNYAQAETMMSEVVAAKPDSAKAHYIYAEVLAHNAHFDQAAEQARQAQAIDPALGFTKPAKFREFQQLLEREQQSARTPNASSMTPALGGGFGSNVQRKEHGMGGIPGWVWGGLIALVAFVLWRMVQANRANLSPSFMPAAPAGAYPVAPAGPYYGGPGGGYGQAGYGAPGAGPGFGGSALRTGAAVVGGMAAGALIDEMLHSNREGAGNQPFSGFERDSFAPGNQPNVAADELERRDVDFGNGNDWSSGGGSDGSDLGGGGGGSDGW
jgi:hypothetical protein